MAIYESVFIVDSLVAPNEIEAILQRLSSIITDHNGTVRKIDKWGKRRLAYEIEKKQYGYYIALEFEVDASTNLPKQLEYEFNFNDKVMRFLTYRYDKNKLRAMAKEQKETEEVTSETSSVKETENKPVAPAESAAEEKTSAEQDSPNEQTEENV
ncbi:MAG: 30S ribosomal protein S6 [Caldithrix sp.]|nr:30S ribosomal protein S6 [Caldithrix sp.]